MYLRFNLVGTRYFWRKRDFEFTLVLSSYGINLKSCVVVKLSHYIDEITIINITCYIQVIMCTAHTFSQYY